MELDWAWPGLPALPPTRAWLPAAFPAQAVEGGQSRWELAGRCNLSWEGIPCPSSELLLKVGRGRAGFYRKTPRQPGRWGSRRAGWGWGGVLEGSTGLAANRNGNQARNPGGGGSQAGPRALRPKPTGGRAEKGVSSNMHLHLTSLGQEAAF